MMVDELKTLKDIGGRSVMETDVVVSRHQLRAEAVKWAKEMRSGVDAIRPKSYSMDGVSIQGWLISAVSAENKIDFIKIFFNLTEDDLR